jgi:hypothetical protein
MRPFILALCAASGACAPEPSSAVATAGAGTADPLSCALTVRFGSYAMGIDAGTAERVEQLLRADRSVGSVERRPWGKEGEVDLCAQVQRAGDAARLFERIRPLLPPKPRGPIIVSLADGRQYQVPPS